MPFESREEAPSERAATAAAEIGSEPSRHLSLRLAGRQVDPTSIAVSPAERPGKLTLRDVQTQISYLTGQIETLRQQLYESPSERLALLLREMIAERERELQRWLAQEQRWDERIAAIETAIVERDQSRERETTLRRERDEAKRAAAEAERRLELAQHAVEDAYRLAQTMERAAERAQAEQLRLRQEREMDNRVLVRERQRLASEQAQRGWIARLRRK